MPRILVDPTNLGLTLVGIAALISVGYFLRVRDKSASTWFVMAFLVAWASYTLGLTFWVFTHDAFTSTAAMFFTPYGRFIYTVGALSGPLLVQAAYRFRSHLFRLEATIVFVFSAISTVLIMTLNPNATSGQSFGRILVALYALWGTVVLLRKRAKLPATEEFARDRMGMIAVATFFVVVAVSESFNGFIVYQGSAPTLSLFILGQILQFAVVLAFPAVYVQYAPEPTTFQVKLVGFVLLVVVSVFGILAAFASGLDERRQVFDPAPPPSTLVFIPTSDGRFEVSRTKLSFDEKLGQDLELRDDDKARVALPFGFPFADDTLRSIIVDANGAIRPTEDPLPESNFSVDFPTVSQHPVIAALHTDLNPGVGGGVYADVRPDRVVVTWNDVPEWTFYMRYTFQAVLYNSGRIDFNYAELPFNAVVGALGILSDPASLRETEGGAPSLDRFVGIGTVQNPVTIFARQIEFKEFLHRESMPFVWVVLATIAFVLLFAPVFFRLTLTRPLERLLQGMRKVNDGDLDAALPVVVKDEFGNLSMNFNRMTQSLRVYAHDMETLVAERTRALNESLETLKETQEQLVQQEKMASLGELTAGIAHEIKNPLNFINNFADLNAELARELKEAIDNGEDTTELLQTLEQNAGVIAEHGRRADGIVRSMMEHAGNGGSIREKVDINVFVEEYLTLAYHGRLATTPEFDVALKRSYAADAGSATIARQEIGKVLMNLLGNAFDAVEAISDAIVGVATRREAAAEDAGEVVVIELWDNGPGVPPDLKRKIFEPFFTTKPTGKGTGLGLSLSYDIVTRGHGGTLQLEDASAGGTKLVVKLPV